MISSDKTSEDLLLDDNSCVMYRNSEWGMLESENFDIDAKYALIRILFQNFYFERNFQNYQKSTYRGYILWYVERFVHPNLHFHHI